MSPAPTSFSQERFLDAEGWRGYQNGTVEGSKLAQGLPVNDKGKREGMCKV